jgi:hypothetical protein
MEDILRRLDKCKIDAEDFHVDLARDAKISLECLDPIPEDTEAEPAAAQLPVGCRASLYDAIRGMSKYGSTVETEKRRNDRDGLFRPRG